MNKQDAKRILEDLEVIQKDKSLDSESIEGMPRIDWPLGCQEVWLCDNFTADQLEAIAWWMKNKS